MERQRYLGKFLILCTLLAAAFLIGPGVALSTPIYLGDSYKADYQGPTYDRWYTQYKFALTGEPFSEKLGDWEYTNPAIAFCIDATLGTAGPYWLDTFSDFKNNSDRDDYTSPDYEISKLERAAKYADYFFTNGGDQSAYQIAIWMELGIKYPISGNALSASAEDIRLAKDLAGVKDWDNYSLANSLVVAFSKGGQNYLRRSAAPVPEPGTIVLMGLGLVGLAGVGRKKLFKK
jgi:hypothetical protein